MRRIKKFKEIYSPNSTQIVLSVEFSGVMCRLLRSSIRTLIIEMSESFKEGVTRIDPSLHYPSDPGDCPVGRIAGAD